MALMCSRVPITLPPLLSKLLPGHRLGHPLSPEALGCVFRGRNEFRGIYQALSTSAEVFALQIVPFCTEKPAASAVLSRGRWPWSCHLGEMGSSGSP